MDEECAFCGIVAGRLVSSPVYEDDLVVAFMDLYPVTPGHVLVVPRAHVAGLGDLDDALGARLWSAARRIGTALRGGAVRCEGVNLFLADGEAAGQEIFHVHLHVFPRFAGDPFSLHALWEEADREVLHGQAARLRALLPGS
ncbi:histidine triad (HIT) family protein [Nocardiopsis flavescens]|uniref:Histidine triad (HIT) family protein n=1 Tax=Nocardiopsis flavescens TaxID=758803 RepID=A0A1M6AMI2_9ACTN|nr:HIT family protein [Nocardiopsis flavescens]SHI37710.1 histidine triad (HIT) family protein [Nocardiopsis flavescens]